MLLGPAALATMPAVMPRLLAAAVIAATLAGGARDALAEGGAGWATAQAAELTRQGQAHAARGDVEVAARRLLDAIELDVTFGPAYLALGGVDEAKGDLREAERVYSMGIDHVVGFTEGLVARGRLRARQHRLAEALPDLEAASSSRPDDPSILRELYAAYLGAGALPAALSASRRLGLAGEAVGDARAIAEAKAATAALEKLVGALDPVLAGAQGRGTVRRALWLSALPARSRRR